MSVTLDHQSHLPTKQVSLADAVQNWELLGTQLAASLADYLDACVTLESSATKLLPDNNSVVPKLDSALGTLYARMNQQLLHSRSFMARTRNKLAITMYHFPDEVLSHIFSMFIYNTNREEVLLPESGVWLIYRRLHTLIGVCSDWRRLCLSRGMFWSLIPVRRLRSEGYEWDHIDRILARSQGSNLYLSGILNPQPESPLALQNIVAQHGPRFRSLNLAGKNSHALRDMAARLLPHGNLTDFSICYLSEEAAEFLFPAGSPENASFRKTAKTLKSLRLCSLNLHWGDMQFDSLTELKIQNLAPQRSYMIRDLLAAISSAPHLRLLHLTRVSRIQEVIDIPPPNNPPITPFTFPSLRWLYLENIHKNLVANILCLIAPGSYKTELHFTRASNFYSTDEFDDNWARGINIDTLMITDWLVDGEKLRRLLKTMPTLTTFYIANRILREETFRALTRPVQPSLPGEDIRFPKLHALYVNNSILCFPEKRTLARFQEVITSHGIRELGIEGVLELPKESDPQSTRRYRFHDPDDDQITAPIKEWITNNVPKFIVVKAPEDMPFFDFQTCFRRLWHRG